MRRSLFITALVLATVLLAALGACISLVRTIRGRITGRDYATRLVARAAPSWAGR
jgi:hypothetical protein